MDIKTWFYISSRWVGNWAWCNLEVSLYGWSFRWRYIFSHICYFHIFYRAPYLACRIHHWSVITKRCCFSLFIFRIRNELASYWKDGNCHFIYSFVILQRCWWLDFILYRKNFNRESVITN